MINRDMAYTYLIGWSRLNYWYYGVRFAKECCPDDLWTTYFTSSKMVYEMRIWHGEPDIIQVRKIFKTKEQAQRWETKILQKLDVLHKSKWLNQTTNRAIINNLSKQKEIAQKVSQALKGRIRTKEHCKALSIAKRGKCQPNVSKALKGRTYEQIFGSKKAEEIRQKKNKSISQLRWINNSLTNKRIKQSQELPIGWCFGRIPFDAIWCSKVGMSRKKVRVNDVIYNSQTEAAKAYGIATASVKDRIISKNFNWSYV